MSISRYLAAIGFGWLEPTREADSPDIDLPATMSFTLVDGDLRVLAQLTGDRFPNAEMFITNGRRNSRMLMTYETTRGPLGGPEFALAGNGQLAMKLHLHRLLRRWQRAFHLRAATILAAAMSAVGAILAAYQDGRISAFVALPVAVLFIAPFFKEWLRLLLAAELVLIALLISLGSIWPSLYTLAALRALPSFVLGIIYMVKGCAPRWGEIYILVSALLASTALLYQRCVLATAQY